jgi:hypothetical protein
MIIRSYLRNVILSVAKHLAKKCETLWSQRALPQSDMVFLRYVLVTRESGDMRKELASIINYLYADGNSVSRPIHDVGRSLL